jgi:parvulin-like peptidyl-prolyl isomerase
MRWRGRLARAFYAAALAAGGCTAGPPAVSALPPEPAPVAEVTRAQKPEPRPRPGSAVCLIGLPVDRPAEASHASPAAVIRAVVNGEPILEEEVRASCYQMFFAARTDAEREEVLKQALEQIIDREVILQEAFSRLERGGPQGAKMLDKLKEEADKDFTKRWLRPIMKQNHIDDREEFAAFMHKHGLSMDLMRRWWTRNFLAQQYLFSRIEPHLSRIGHTEIAAYYAEHKEEFTQPDSVQWQDIFIDATRHASRAAARQFADSLAARARAGEDFAKLSEEFDNGTSGRFRKGEGQGRKHGEIFPPEAEPVLFRLHDGDLEVIERARGFHVVRLVKREYAGPIPFDGKVQKEIKDKLRSAVFQREMKGVLAELKRRAVIDRADRKN